MEELFRKLIDYAADNYDPEQDCFIQTTLEDALEEVCNEMYPWGYSNEKEEKKVKEMALKKYGRIIRKIAEFHYEEQ